jgi:hypothetical protein
MEKAIGHDTLGRAKEATMRFGGLGLAIIAVAAVTGAPVLAQSGLPCDAFVKNQDGSWQATRNVAVPGPGRVFNVNQGALFKPGGSFMGMELAADLERECPAAVEAAAVVATQVELPKYAAPNGNIDTDKLTCAQFADLPPDDADFLGTWTLGWQNGAAKNRAINVIKVRETIRGVAVYCKANKDKRFVQAVDVVMKAEKR